VEDDTDLAPSFVLVVDRSNNKIISGNVWEDSDKDKDDDLRLGDGQKSSKDKNVANVKVELYTVKDDGSLELAELYSINKDTAKVEVKKAETYTDKNGNYSFGDTIFSVPIGRYIIKFTYGGSEKTSIDEVEISARDYKSTIISADSNLQSIFKGESTDEEWHLKIPDGRSIAVDDIPKRAEIADLQYSNFEKKERMEAWSKAFTTQVEFDANKQSSVDLSNGKTKVGDNITVNGITKFDNELSVFDFGIIERAIEDIFVETTVENIKIALANGQELVNGSPKDKLNYTKATGFNQEINNGEQARKASEKQVAVEIDTELIQGATLEIKYGIKVTNKSEKEIDTNAYYMYGEYDKDDPIVSSSVKELVYYLDGEFKEKGTNYNWENEGWTLKQAEELLKEELISQATYDAVKENGYTTFITEKFNDLAPGQKTRSDYLIVKKTLSNQDENIYDGHAEILKIDTKTAKTIKKSGVTKEYKMGNYVPSLKTRNTNANINTEKAGRHEQDDDRVKIVITPPTGATTYIITYATAGLVGSIVIAIVVIFIKKKVYRRQT